MTKRKSRPGAFEPFVPLTETALVTLYGAIEDSHFFQFPYLKRGPNLYQVTGTGDNKQEVLLASDFYVLGHGRDRAGLGWGILIVFKNFDGNHKIELIRRKDLVSDRYPFFETLADAAFNFDPDKKRQFRSALLSIETDARVTLVSKPGWMEVGGDYMIGSEIVAAPLEAGKPKERYHRVTPPGEILKAGTLQGWRDQVSLPCQGNSRFVLAISAAFAGPLLRLFGSDSFAINLRGETSSGKSTALFVALSVGGVPYRTWKNTSNALEGIAEECNDGLLGVDELGVNVSVDIGADIYTAIAGQGKGRADRAGETKKPKTWTTLLLSTGELTLEAKMKEANRASPMRGGQEVRFIDIEADAGCGLKLFERLPPDADNWDCKENERGKEFSKRLKAAAAANSGWALPEFIRAIQRDNGEAVKLLRGQVSKVFSENFPGLNEQAGRVVDHFIILATAGEFATLNGITGWEPGEATKSAMTCFRVWQEPRSEGNFESRTAIQTARDFIELHENRFQPINLSDDDIAEFNKRIPLKAGYVKEIDGDRVFFISPGVWNSEVFKGYNGVDCAKHLDRAGFLLRDNAKPTAKQRWTKALRLGPKQTAGYYAVKSSIRWDADGTS